MQNKDEIKTTFYMFHCHCLLSNCSYKCTKQISKLFSSWLNIFHLSQWSVSGTICKKIKETDQDGDWCVLVLGTDIESTSGHSPVLVLDCHLAAAGGPVCLYCKFLCKLVLQTVWSGLQQSRSNPTLKEIYRESLFAKNKKIHDKILSAIL